VQLFDLAAGAEVARLLAPDAHFIDRFRFAPDGSRLAVATENRVIQLWDLRAVRQELRKMGLDWDLPPYPDYPLAPGEKVRVALFPDTIEAENLKLLAAEKCPWAMRDTSPRGRGAWGNDRELFGEAEEGGYLELEIDAPRAGRYALAAWFTQGPDCGVVEVSLDGRRVGGRFDGFHDTVVRSERTAFGTADLGEGRHRLRFTAAGKGPRATACHFAVDCLELLPADGSPGR
jgi:hypothetical protein